MDDDVAVKEVGGLVALDLGRVVAHERPLVEPGPFRAEERPATTSPLAHVVNLGE